MSPRVVRRAAHTAAVAAVSFLTLTAIAPPEAGADPRSGEQWAFGAADPIGAREAWTRSQGQGVVVAVVDTGVQIDHPDLAGAIWTNPAETPNGRDDDGNGYVDDLRGANAVTGSGDVGDREGHGTAVAGIIAARAGNGTGGQGIAPGATIMPVKVAEGPDASVFAIGKGIRYAVDHGAKVVSVSIGAPGTIAPLDEAIAYAEARGVSVVASAGNAGVSFASAPEFPAASPNANVLAVGASGPDGRLIDSSNFGRAVDVAAPGDDILTTANGSGYTREAGTSMATPFVSGALALLQSARPDATQAQLRAVLLASARRSAATSGKVATGVLDAGAAMHAAVPGAWGARAGRAAATRGARGGARLQLSTKGRPRAGRTATVTWKAVGAATVTRWTVRLDGRVVRTARRASLRRASARVARAGRHRFTVTGFDRTGAKVVSANRTFRARR